MSDIEYDPENVFKKIIKGEIPSYKIFETDNVVAILDAFPVVEGHCLLIPKAEGYATIMDLPDDVSASLFKELPRLAKAVQKAYKCDGINIIQNNGKASGQAVFHVHIHVIPRYEGDKLISFPTGTSMIESGKAAEVKEKIQAML